MLALPTICLCMIVRNESAIIARALRSALPLIDYWIVCDTGSTDNTPLAVLQELGGVPGELHRTEWVNFGVNREEALRLAQQKSDYVLILDADMVVNVWAPFKHKLTADYYEIRYEGPLDYTQPMLLASGHAWHYVGVTHEYLSAPTAQNMALLPELTLTHLGDGGGKADKFTRDVRLLTAWLSEHPDDPRALFYLAQSYRDLDDFASALACYERRAALVQGWEEERWYASYQVASMRQRLGHDWAQQVLPAYLAAYAARPWRLEPLHAVVQHCRATGHYALGHLYGARLLENPAYPPDMLFIDKPVYHYLLALEFGVCAYGAGYPALGLAAFNTVLRQPDLPSEVADAARRGQLAAWEVLFPPQPPPAGAAPNRLVVVTAFHNPGPYLAQCLDSLLAQDHPNFRVLLLDDASTDGATAAVPVHDPRFRLVRSPRRRGLAYHLPRLINAHCRPDDVVVCLDGDDWLASPDALSLVDARYQAHNCWVLYGQFRYASGGPGFCQPYASAADFATLRADWRTSHLRTFRAGLFQAIATQDPDYQCFKDEQGAWLTAATDAALMYPLLEMAGFDRVRFNPDVLCIYNDANPASHHHQGRTHQLRQFQVVQAKRPFARIADYHALLKEEADLAETPAEPVGQLLAVS